MDSGSCKQDGLFQQITSNSSEIAQNYPCCFPEITIGFEQSTYTVQEAPQSTVATVCADILEGSVQMGIGFTFGTIDGLAGT